MGYRKHCAQKKDIALPYQCFLSNTSNAQEVHETGFESRVITELLIEVETEYFKEPALNISSIVGISSRTSCILFP